MKGRDVGFLFSVRLILTRSNAENFWEVFLCHVTQSSMELPIDGAAKSGLIANNRKESIVSFLERGVCPY